MSYCCLITAILGSSSVRVRIRVLSDVRRGSLAGRYHGESSGSGGGDQ